MRNTSHWRVKKEEQKWEEAEAGGHLLSTVLVLTAAGVMCVLMPGVRSLNAHPIQMGSAEGELCILALCLHSS